MPTSSPMFSNVQMELLKLYANDVPDERLHELKLLLGRYFAEKATEAMDNVWEGKNLTADDMAAWTHEHNRRQGRH